MKMKLDGKAVLLLPAALAAGYAADISQNTLVARAAETYWLPMPVRKSMANGGISRFYGPLRLKFEGNQVLANVYDIKQTDSSPNSLSYIVQDYAPTERVLQLSRLGSSGSTWYNGLQRCELTLFTRLKNGRLQRINTTRFNYVRAVNTQLASTEHVGVSTAWLDPKHRKKPILNVDFREEGVEGPCGTNMLIVFPNGLSGKAISEGFTYGANNSAERSVWQWILGEADAKGYITVQSVRDNRYTNANTWHQWSGKLFVPVESTSSNREP